MLDDLRHAQQLAREWAMPVEDVVLIALNHCGLNNGDLGSRSRIVLRMHTRPEEQIHLILSFRRPASPFALTAGALTLDGEEFASVERLDADDAVLGYWRNGHRVLTLNSNARSQCVGCVFCPNTLEEAADPVLRAAPDLSSYFATVSDQRGGDLREVERVTVCTGCFRYESMALDHLGQVRTNMSAHDCNGVLHFLSSVVTSDEGLATASALGPFHLTLTAECFGRRDEVLKESKARLTLDGMVDLLGRAGSAGIDTDFTYIVGLDPAAEAMAGIRRLAPFTSTFPRLQVYQAHTSLMDVYLADGARGIAYYLRMRRELEEVFGPTGMRPQPWENYRSLWYFSFGDEPLTGARI